MSFTQDQVKEAIGLGTLNPKILNQFFYEVKLRSYDYDYAIQDQLIDLTDYKDSFYTVMHKKQNVTNGVRDEGLLDTVGTFDIPKSIIGYFNRKTYRHSDLYDQPVTIDTIAKNPNLFKFAVLCFINNRLTLDYKVHPKDNITSIYFPFATYGATSKENDEVRALFIPDAIAIHSRGISVQDKPSAKVLKANIFDSSINWTKYKGFFCYLIHNTNATQPIFRAEVTYEESSNTFKFVEDLPVDMSLYTVLMVGMEDYSQTISGTPADTYLQIEREKMPIPKNNFIIMVRDANGLSYHLNDDEITIEEHYPNVYKVINPNKNYFKIIALYVDEPQNIDLDYDIEIQYYLDKVNELERYRNGTIPDILSEYKPIDWDYFLNDYLEDTEIPELKPNTDRWYAFLYKLNKINSIYKKWCYFFQLFLRKTYGYLENWVLDISTIDLDARYRTSTAPEIPMSALEYREFTRPQYVFSYKNDFGTTDLPYAWFVDGTFLVPDYSIYYQGIQYVYFNATAIKADSYMEVERYDGVAFSKQITVQPEGTYFKLNTLKHPILLNSIYLTRNDQSYASNGENVNLYINDPEAGLILADLDNSVYIISKNTEFFVEPVRQILQPTTVWLNCNNDAKAFSYTPPEGGALTGFPDLNSDNIVKSTKQEYLSRIRIFNTEGRTFPRDSYQQTIMTYKSDRPYFTVQNSASAKLTYGIEYMGYDQKLVYSQANIPENGYLDLEGKLDKPFSLVYHDVFLNGFKLNTHNIEVIAPFHIAIKNVRTRNTLEIYERVKGTELFFFDTENQEESQYLADKLFNTDDDYRESVLEDLPEIDVDPGIIDIEDFIDVVYNILNDWWVQHFMNMDTEYTPEQFNAYEKAFTDGWRFLMNADHRLSQAVPEENWFYISHDKEIERDPEGSLYAAHPELEPPNWTWDTDNHYWYDSVSDMIMDPQGPPPDYAMYWDDTTQKWYYYSDDTEVANQPDPPDDTYGAYWDEEQQQWIDNDTGLPLDPQPDPPDTTPTPPVEDLTWDDTNHYWVDESTGKTYDTETYEPPEDVRTYDTTSKLWFYNNDNSLVWPQPDAPSFIP